MLCYTLHFQYVVEGVYEKMKIKHAFNMCTVLILSLSLIDIMFRSQGYLFKSLVVWKKCFIFDLYIEICIADHTTNLFSPTSHSEQFFYA